MGNVERADYGETQEVRRLLVATWRTMMNSRSTLKKKFRMECVPSEDESMTRWETDAKSLYLGPCLLLDHVRNKPNYKRRHIRQHLDSECGRAWTSDTILLLSMPTFSSSKR